MHSRPPRMPLSSLVAEHLVQNPAWRPVVDLDDEEDPQLEALELAEGRVPIDAGPVYCRSLLTFADGSQWQAAALCHSDGPREPHQWLVWNGRDAEPVTLVLPPATSFELAADGPEPFAKRFDRSIDAVFPVRCDVLAEFESPRHRRAALLHLDGRIELVHPA